MLREKAKQIIAETKKGVKPDLGGFYLPPDGIENLNSNSKNKNKMQGYVSAQTLPNSCKYKLVVKFMAIWFILVSTI